MVKEMVFVTAEVRKDINVKDGGAKGPSHTIMADPKSLVASLVRSSINSVLMGDHNDVPLKVFFRKHDLSNFGEYKIRDLFDGNETIYVKEA